MAYYNPIAVNQTASGQVAPGLAVYDDTAAASTFSSSSMETSTTGVIDDQPLVCTMGVRTNSTQMFPPDGLCEYLFYDSLYIMGRNTFAPRDQFDVHLKTFVEIASSYKTTSFGVGFTYSSAYHLEAYLLQQATKKFNVMKNFWDHSIYHIGVVDSATVNPTEAELIPALILRDNFSQEIVNQGIKVFTFFAANIPDAGWARFYIRNFTNVIMPDVYIALGHYSRGDNGLPSCRAVPPTLLQKPQGAEDSYQYDLTTAAESIVRLSGLGLKSVLSVSLKGHLALLTDPDKRGFLAPCMTNNSLDSFASYAEYIREEVARQLSLVATINGTPTTLDHSLRRAIQRQVAEALPSPASPISVAAPLTFAEAVRRPPAQPPLPSYSPATNYYRSPVSVYPLCKIKEQHIDTKFGIAVFDIDYADFSNACRSRGGPFARLHLLRSILNFFRTRYRSAADMKDCMQLAYQAMVG
ncbi:hypothetical protein HPB51_019291 [Rhipicephalus microplus]|uniref:Uncharacterized protein n=1 Tax=Rhipicephalus microplus TaxID=6941 RepID=A0A9J6ETX0_RHIMP|nr:hypothetical protein HPB51_019291 [Rhipicephalus microplus]